MDLGRFVTNCHTQIQTPTQLQSSKLNVEHARLHSLHLRMYECVKYLLRIGIWIKSCSVVIGPGLAAVKSEVRDNLALKFTNQKHIHTQYRGGYQTIQGRMMSQET